MENLVSRYKSETIPVKNWSSQLDEKVRNEIYKKFDLQKRDFTIGVFTNEIDHSLQRYYIKTYNPQVIAFVKSATGIFFMALQEPIEEDIGGLLQM